MWALMLLQREHGMVSCDAFRRVTARRRVGLLRASPLRDVPADGHDSGITDLDLDPDEGRHLLAGGSDGGLHVHDLASDERPGPRQTARLVARVGRGHPDAHAGSVASVQWLPADGAMFVTGGADKTVKFWDANRLRAADSYSFEGGVRCHHLSGLASSHQERFF